MLLDEAANRFHSVGLSLAIECHRPAAQAGAISRLLGLFRFHEKLNVLPAWPPRRARRPAVHARARNRKDEFSVAGGITGQYGTPARGVLRSIVRAMVRVIVRRLVSFNRHGSWSRLTGRHRRR